MKLLAWLSLALALAAGAPETRAHSWFDPWCCNDRDCQPIPDSAVKITPQGYVITLAPGDHPMLAKETQTRTYTVPYANARVSLDPEQRFYACIYPDPSSMRCFYAKPSGS